MLHRNTVLSHVRWHRFDTHVTHHGANKPVRKLPTKTQFIAMAYGQMSGADGLRETVTRFKSHGAKLYHLWTSKVARSTLAEANQKRPGGVFKDLVAVVYRRLRQKLEDATHLIDSTSQKLNERRWAIEPHVRLIKQALKIKRFFGPPDNAVRTRVYIALIVFPPPRMAHAGGTPALSLLEFVRLVRAHVMDRRDARALDGPDDPPTPDPRQHFLNWSPA